MAKLKVLSKEIGFYFGFNPIEFEGFGKWIEATNSIGVISKGGK